MKNWILSKKTQSIINILLIATILAIVIIPSKKDSKNIGIVTRDADNSYKLTNPILDYENLSSGEQTSIPIGLMDDKVEDLKNKYGISHISLYYRDMNNGQWIGVDEKEDFSPASLLKVPTMIAFLKSAESNPGVLGQKTVIKNIDNARVEQNINFEGTVKPGEEHTYMEILASMIAKSDNIAAQTILNTTEPSQIKKVFSSVGVPFVDTKTEPVLRVKDYAGFFRVLYNATYLNREMSELALEILSMSEYKNGLVAGVPSDVTVAHKFGERSIVNTIDGKSVVDQTQIHDCGIVYFPKDPYLLCIMTRGDNFTVQEKAIQELSRFIYNELNK